MLYTFALPIWPFAGAVLDGLDDLGSDAGVDVGAVRCGRLHRSMGRTECRHQERADHAAIAADATSAPRRRERGTNGLQGMWKSKPYSVTGSWHYVMTSLENP